MSYWNRNCYDPCYNPCNNPCYNPCYDPCYNPCYNPCPIIPPTPTPTTSTITLTQGGLIPTIESSGGPPVENTYISYIMGSSNSGSQELNDPNGSGSYTVTPTDFTPYSVVKSGTITSVKFKFVISGNTGSYTPGTSVLFTASLYRATNSSSPINNYEIVGTTSILNTISAVLPSNTLNISMSPAPNTYVNVGDRLIVVFGFNLINPAADVGSFSLTGTGTATITLTS